MVEALKSSDMVLGSRFAKGGKVDEKWAWWRKLLSWFANSVYLRLILRTRIRDLTGCSVAAVERGEQLLMQFGADFRFEPTDKVYICGSREATRRFVEQFQPEKS